MQSYDDSDTGSQHAWGGLGGSADLALMGGYMVAEWGHGHLTQDAFYKAGNETLVKGAKKKLLSPKAFDAYAAKTYSKYAASAAEKEGAEVLGEAAFKSTLRKSAIKLGSAEVLGAGLNLVNAFWLAPMLYGAAYHGFKGIQRLGYQLQRPHFGANMTLSTSAFTDRQRGIQAMHNSELNARSSMGREAFLLHQ